MGCSTLAQRTSHGPPEGENRKSCGVCSKKGADWCELHLLSSVSSNAFFAVKALNQCLVILKFICQGQGGSAEYCRIFEDLAALEVSGLWSTFPRLRLEVTGLSSPVLEQLRHVEKAAELSETGFPPASHCFKRPGRGSTSSRASHCPP